MSNEAEQSDSSATASDERVVSISDAAPAEAQQHFSVGGGGAAVNRPAAHPHAEEDVSSSAEVTVFEEVIGRSLSVSTAVAVGGSTVSGPKPPAALIIDLIMDPATAFETRANLEELFAGYVHRHGERWARLLFFGQAFRIAIRGTFDRWFGRLERAVKLLKPWS